MTDIKDHGSQSIQGPEYIQTATSATSCWHWCCTAVWL